MKIISLVVGLTVGVLLMVGLVSPVVSSGVENTTTEANNASQRYIMANENTVTMEALGSGAWSINSETFTIPSPYFTVGFGEKGLIRFGTSTAEVMEGTTVYSSIKKMVYEGSILTLTKNDDTTTALEWSYLFYPSVSGNWGMFEHVPGLTEKVNIDNNQSAYFVANTSWSDAVGKSFYGVWEIKNGEVTNTVVPFTYNTTYNGPLSQDPNATVTMTYTDSEDGLSKEYSGGEVTSGSDTYRNQSYIIAPIVYHVHTPADNMTIAMLEAIVMIGFVALIAFAAFAVRGRMND